MTTKPSFPAGGIELQAHQRGLTNQTKRDLVDAEEDMAAGSFPRLSSPISWALRSKHYVVELIPYINWNYSHKHTSEAI